MNLLKTAVAAAIAALAATSAHAALLANADFETPAAPYGLPSGWDGSTATPGGPQNSPNVFVASGADYIPCCAVIGSPAALANHFVTFGAGDSPHVGGLLGQTFATVAGQTYLLSFLQATFGAAGTQTLEVRIGDVTHNALVATQAFTVATDNNLDTGFTHQSLVFTATGAVSRLQIENISGVTDSIDAVVDDFAIIPRGGAGGAPEPASWALMVGGFGAAGAFLRLRARPRINA